jgi:hypothetical protein
VEGYFKHGNKHSGYINGREFVDKLSDYWLLNKDFAPWNELERQSVTIQSNDVSSIWQLCFHFSLSHR